ncbi:MAG TPA: zinc ribbon domain-containing protein [Candidatus Limnocylindria bacterium]|nr:zinc ribbon domain-containing protein [Candidatus Limnocylindria bacterium]
MGALEPGHLVIILIIALFIFGPSKVGELGGTLGRAVRDFRDAADGKIPTPPSAPTRSCVNCRAAIPSEAKFCPGCGLTVSTVATDTTA